jgi:molybdopterin-binding protein
MPSQEDMRRSLERAKTIFKSTQIDPNYAALAPAASSIHRGRICGDRTMALLTVRAAAGRLGVGYSTLKRWVHTGRVRTTRTAGGHHRVPEAEIDRLTARQPSARNPRGSRRRDEDAPLAGLSARNQLRGFVEEVRVDGLLAQVRLRVGDQTLTAVITADAVRALRLRRGDDALAIVKSTEVMIARAGGPDEASPKIKRRKKT